MARDAEKGIRRGDMSAPFGRRLLFLGFLGLPVLSMLRHSWDSPLFSESWGGTFFQDPLTDIFRP